MLSLLECDILNDNQYYAVLLYIIGMDKRCNFVAVLIKLLMDKL